MGKGLVYFRSEFVANVRNAGVWETNKLLWQLENFVIKMLAETMREIFACYNCCNRSDENKVASVIARLIPTRLIFLGIMYNIVYATVMQ